MLKLYNLEDNHGKKHQKKKNKKKQLKQLTPEQLAARAEREAEKQTRARELMKKRAEIRDRKTTTASSAGRGRRRRAAEPASTDPFLQEVDATRHRIDALAQKAGTINDLIEKGMSGEVQGRTAGSQYFDTLLGQIGSMDDSEEADRATTAASFDAPATPQTPNLLREAGAAHAAASGKAPATSPGTN
jgi:hypothetical protein